MVRSSGVSVEVHAVSRAELEAQFATAIRGADLSPLPERLRDIGDLELAGITRRLARRQHECGCNAGAWAMCIAAVIATVIGVLHGASSVAGAVALAAVGVGFVLVSTIVIKFVAIAVGRRRWRHDRDAVVASLAEPEGVDHVVVR